MKTNTRAQQLQKKCVCVHGHFETVMATSHFYRHLHKQQSNLVFLATSLKAAKAIS